MGTIQIKKVEKKVVTGKVGENRQKVIRVAIAALTAALTALGTTSCMGYGPF